MKFVPFLPLLVLAVCNISWATVTNPGLLTADYGVVTKADLNEEMARCEPPYESFPPKENACFQYWQCLPTKEVHLTCEDLGANDEYEHIGEATFWIKNGSDIHHFLTRRNFDLESCQEWATEWKEVMRDEEVVCLSGDYIENAGEEPSPALAGNHYYWIIDRMKSRHGEWSYFYRGPIETSAETRSDDVAKRIDVDETPIDRRGPDPRYDPFYESLLTAEDLEREKADHANGSALSSGLHEKEHWESFNEWRCFSADKIEMNCVGVKGESTKIPSLEVKDKRHLHEFSLDLDPSREADCESTIAFWQKLLSGERAFCAYAAYLQDNPVNLREEEGLDRWSLWIVSQIKTAKGTWPAQKF